MKNCPIAARRGFVLDGKRGCGKSGILNGVVAWARQNGWLVVCEPNPYRYINDIAEINRSNFGVYIQNEFAQQFLQRSASACREMLERIPVQAGPYGNCAPDGTHRLTALRVYDSLIEKAIHTEMQNIHTHTHTHTHTGYTHIPTDLQTYVSGYTPSTQVTNNEIESPEFADTHTQEKIHMCEIEYHRLRLKLWNEYRSELQIPTLKSKLPAPRSVYEIVDFGISNEGFATQCVYEFFEQLKRQTTFPLLVVVDRWNECFSKSEYVSIRYDNTRFDGHIPAYHLSMPRVFAKWDGHQYKRGLKLYATSWKSRRRAAFDPQQLGVRKSEIIEVDNFTRSEFFNYVIHMLECEIIYNFPQDKVDYFYMLTGGNGYEARRMLSMLY